LKSLGQTAYEAHGFHLASRISRPLLTRYSDLSALDRSAWEAAGRAIEAQLPVLRFYAINGHTEIYLALNEMQARTYHEHQLGQPVVTIAEVDPYHAVGFIDGQQTRRGTLIDALHQLATEGDVALPCQIWSARIS